MKYTNISSVERLEISILRSTLATNRLAYRYYSVNTLQNAGGKYTR
ncbi:MAG: hypothetical protein CEO19_164 [Parcubacteria group bacterium Gr01-1014_73]|nr:MAG: hypothetical protein CEO19_164 [Parcubacteria group bacterium Gr01-1014_73]